MSDHLPATQSLHVAMDVFRMPVEYFPFMQDWQLLAPCVADHFPATQFLQLVSEGAAIVSDHLPATQS